MSKKRAATTNLNHENWDQEEPKEKEDMGTFSVASDEKLEKRVFRTAKRRIQASGDGAKKGVFSGFGGFNKPPVTSFEFLANLTNGNNTNGGTKSDTAVTSSLFSSKDTSNPSGGLFGSSTFSGTAQNISQFASTAPKTEIPSMTFSSSKADSTVGDSPFKMHSVSSSADSNSKPSAPQVTSTIFGVSSTSPNQNKAPLTNTMFKQPVSSTSTQVQNSAPIVSQTNKTEAKFEKEAEIDKVKSKYYSRLKGLNESVSSWIVKHVEKTPLCFLSPIFKDYNNYLKEIQEEYEAAKVDIEAQANKEISEVKPVFGLKDNGTSLFTNKSSGSTSDVKPTSQSFGINPSTQFGSNTNTTANIGLFGQKPTASIPQSPSKATATLTKGFSFGATSTTSTTKTTPSLSTNPSTGTSPSQGFSFGNKPSPAPENPVSLSSKGFSFGVTPASNESSAFASTNTDAGSPSNKGFSFGMTSTPAPTSSVNTFFIAGTINAGPSPFKATQFGISVPPATSPINSMPGSAIGAAPFSFGIGSGTPFSFSPQTQQQTTPTQNEQEEDQPPKVEFTPVVEENCVYDKKCKIFVKKDGNFVDKGIGTLYVKKIEESGKYQLLVRANTNLGTVLLNMILASAVPTQRMGKNNVMLVCIPTPDANPPPTPVLIRVKTGEEADELLETLNKYKS